MVETTETRLAKMSLTLSLFAWMPLGFAGITLAVLYLITNWINFQYLALWCLVPFVPSFWSWRKHVYRPWTKSQADRQAGGK